MSDSGRSSRGSSRRTNPSAGNRRAAGVRRASGASDAKKPAQGAAASASKGTSRTPKKDDGAKRGAAAGGATAAGAGSRSAASRHAAPARSGRGKGRGKVAATNFLNYPRAGKKGFWRWLPSFRLLAGAFALIVLLGLAGTVWLYKTTEVPEPSDFALAQSSRVYFSDGETEMGKFSDINRTPIANDEIPQTVKDAVVASEDATFYENRGISPKGILRALVNNLSGGARQGGSTITQQYVERYYTGTNTSYVGKVKEMFMAIKIDQELPKDEILSRYLNTIYFGRGAYGIEEASQAYFGKPASEMDESEAALLVAVIPGPSSYDPAVNEEKAQSLWARVIEREVNDTGVLTAQQADALEFPKTVEPKKQNSLGGTNGYLLDQVRTELINQGYTQDELNTGGFKIVSTVDKSVQDNTVQSIEDLGDRPENNRVGTMTLDPSSGAIRGMYGGEDYVKQSINDATQSRMQAGSIFKTFTLVAALQDGYSLYSTWDGNSPKSFPGWTVNNFNKVDYGTVSLAQATTNSINTAFAELNVEMGPTKTKEAAIELGLPETTPGLDDYASNVLGSASPTVREMAEAYATIASGGVYHSAYIVETMTNADGSQEYEHKDTAKRVLDEGVATNATVALQGPPSTGSAKALVDIMDGRPVAGKTGTSESFRSAWFVGFTPQLVTGVGMFQPNADGGEDPLTPWGDYSNITGGSYPTEIWGSIMSRSLEGQDFEDFPEAVRLDNQKAVASTTTTRKSTRTQAPTTKAPTTEAPTTEEPTTEEPTTEEPTTEEPTTEEPTTEEPTTEEPTTEEPAKEEPTTEKSTTTKKPAEKTTTEKPAAEKTTKPSSTKPTTEAGAEEGKTDTGTTGD
ncbi:transglycosylase domain-containing protein [Brachybacterium squillarum]|uniref:transglycosylase domain-containing protein n=1 Tax=Brachybacterium squillarum TaxID=661979 RepID=UPI002221FC3D|nr:transglycosylase domain-containing protein [Brachybacterium squillarum]MCW1805321.1 penicillin-binding protein [Brachybacterium squillarum]